MKISASEAAVLNVRERDMLKSTGPWHVRDLVSLIKRLRDLRDKQRQLGQRQVIASARAAKGKAAAGNARTLQKGRLLDKALKHFEGELEAINTQSTAAAATLKVANKPATKAKAKKSPARKASAKKAKLGKSPAGEAPVKKSKAKKAAAKKSAVKKPAARKTAAKTPAKKMAAAKATAKKGPKRKVSDKARIKLPKGGRGDAPSQVASLPSRHKKARRSR